MPTELHGRKTGRHASVLMETHLGLGRSSGWQHPLLWMRELGGKSMTTPSGIGLGRQNLLHAPSGAACTSDQSSCSLGVDSNYQLPITKWPHQSGAPVGAAPPTRSQLRLQRRTQTPVQNSHNGCHQPTLDPLLANVCQASPFRLAMC